MDLGKRVAIILQDLRGRRGWSHGELALRARVSEQRLNDLEIAADSMTLSEITSIADAFEITPGSLLPLDHKLETEWGASAWDVLSATARGFRAKVCVLGKLAEFKLFEIIEEHRELDSRLSTVTWNDADDQPDFLVTWDGAPVRIECKNVRRYADKPSRLRVELQKTRNSKDGSNTRSYRRDKFDVLAACLYNQARSWRFVFCPTKHLVAPPSLPDLLAIYHEIPSPTTLPWTDKLIDALQESR